MKNTTSATGKMPVKLDRELLKIVLGIYLPGFFIQLGMSIASPFDPLFSRELGADIGMIGLIAAAGGIGQLLFDLPGGWLAGKIKEKSFLLVSVAGLAVSIFLKANAQTALQLFFIALFMGICTSAWGLGRLAYMRRRIPAKYRGRAMAAMGGIMRVSRIISPVIGGLIIRFFGFRIVYLIQAGLTVLAVILAFILIEKKSSDYFNRDRPGEILRDTFRKNGRNIIAAMLGITGLQLLRFSRALLFPLWADHIGISVEMIGGITSFGGVIETIMVIPAGIVLDKKGRKWAAVPCTLGMAIGIAILPLSSNFAGIILVYSLMALGNGIGSGINMTISSDLSPKRAASEFLGIWRFVTDSAQISGPVIAGYLAQLFSLSIAPVSAGAIGIIATAILFFGMKETGKTASSANTRKGTPDANV